MKLERLTSKIEEGWYAADFKKDEYETKKGVINKLGQLEDIEEKRQVDFKILDEALEKGVYARCKDGNVRYLGFVSFRKSFGVYWIIASNCLWRFTAAFTQYGNSWALTKEELQ